MRISHDKVIDCSAITAEACSDRCLAALGHKADFALMADTPTSTVHGSVSIVHNGP